MTRLALAATLAVGLVVPIALAPAALAASAASSPSSRAPAPAQAPAATATPSGGAAAPGGGAAAEAPGAAASTAPAPAPGAADEALSPESYQAMPTAPAAVDPAVQKALESAKALIKKGSLTKAREALEKLIAAHEDAAEAYYLLGGIFYRNKGWADAAAKLGKAEQLGFPADDLQSMLGLSLYNIGEKEKAQPHLVRAESLDPNNAEVPYRLALIILGAAKSAAEQKLAIAPLVHATSLDAKNVDAWTRLGLVHFGSGELELAKGALEKAYRERADLPDVVLHLARIAAAQKDETTAKKQYLAILKLKPAAAVGVEANLYVGRLELSAKNASGALAYFRSVLAIDAAEPQASYLAGIILMDAGKVTEAEPLLAKAVEKDTENADARYRLAVLILKRGGDKEAALKVLKESVALEAKNADAHYRIGVICYDALKYPEAERALEKAVTHDPKLVDGHYRLGMLRLARNAKERAATDFEKVIALEPTHVEANYRLGLLAFDNNKKMADTEKYMTAVVTKEPGRTDAHLKLALVHEAMGAKDKAEAELRTVIAQDPKIALAHHRLGLLLFAKNQLNEAAKSFATVLSLEPTNVEASYYMGKIALALGKPQDVELYFKNVIGIDPNRADTHYELGLIAFGGGKLDEAESEFEKAVQLNPKNDDAQHRLGLINFQLKRLDKAEKHFYEVLALAQAAGPVESRPAAMRAREIDANYHLGLIYFERSDLTQARKYFEAAAAGNPDLTDAHFHLGLIARAKGEPKVAEERFAHVLQLAPDHVEAQHHMGVLSYQAGALEPAEQYLVVAAQKNPKDVEAHYLLGLIYFRSERFTQAAAELDAAVAIDPKLDDAYYHLGLIHHKAERASEAEQAFAKVLELAPPDGSAIKPELKARVIDSCDHLGLILYQAKRFDDSKKLFDRAARLDPRRSSAHYHLGVMAFAAGQLDAAYTSLKQVLAVEPDHLEANYQLALVTLAQSKKTEAERFLKKVAVLDPKRTDARRRLGLLLFERGALEEAKPELEAVLDGEPADVPACFHLGVIAYRTAHPDEALASFDKVLAVDANHLEAHFHEGLIHLERESLPLAERSFQRVLAQPPSPRHASASFHLGQIMRAQKQPARALEYYDAALALDAKYGEAYYEKGLTLFDLNRDADAAQALGKALAITPGHVGATFQMGLVEERATKVPEALGWFEKTVLLAPDHWQAHLKIGLLERGRKNWPRAEGALRSAIRLNEKLPEAHYALAQVLTAVDDLLGAEEELVATQQLAPAFNESQKLLGDVYLRRRLYRQAKAQLLAARGQNPKDAAVHFGIAQAAIYEGNLGEAKESLRAAFTADPEHVASRLVLAELLLASSEAAAPATLKEIRALVTDALAVDPSSENGQYLLALVDTKLGDKASATQAFVRYLQLVSAFGGGRTAVKDRPLFVPLTETYREVTSPSASAAAALNNLGVSAARAGQLEEAEVKLKAALAKDAGLGEAQFNLGVLHLAREEHEEAIARFSRVLLLTRADAGTLANRSAAHLWRGNTDLARKDAEAALALDGRSVAATQNLGLGFALAGKDADALRLLAKAAALAPGDRNIQLAIAALSLKTKNGTGALAAVERILASGPMPEAFYVRGCAQDEAQQTDAAVQSLRKAVELAPDFVEAHLRLANIYLSQSKLALAREELHRVLLLRPGQAELETKLVGLYTREGLTAKEAAEFKVLHRFGADPAVFAQKQTRRVGLLPFSPTGDVGALADLGIGLARALRLALAPLSGLALSELRDKSGVDEATLGREVGVEAVLSGTFRIEGDRLLLVAKLVDVTDGKALASAEVQGDLAEPVALVKKLGLTVAYAYARVSRAEEKLASETPETPIAALASVSRGERLLASNDPRARGEFETAFDIDATYVAALAEAKPFIAARERAIALAVQQAGSGSVGFREERSLALDTLAALVVPGSTQLSQGRPLLGGILLGAEVAAIGGLVATQVMYQKRYEDYASAGAGANFDALYDEASSSKLTRDAMIGALVALGVGSAIEVLVHGWPSTAPTASVEP